MNCAKVPCSSCPYRKDTPPGVWAAEEYQKLTAFSPADGQVPALGIFLCHQTNATGVETICRGWLSVERDSVAVRLALIRGQVTVGQVEAAVGVPLYPDGATAARVGLGGVKRPGLPARRMSARLLKKRAGKS